MSVDQLVFEQKDVVPFDDLGAIFSVFLRPQLKNVHDMLGCMSLANLSSLA